MTPPKVSRATRMSLSGLGSAMGIRYAGSRGGEARQNIQGEEVGGMKQWFEDGRRALFFCKSIDVVAKEGKGNERKKEKRNRRFIETHKFAPSSGGGAG